MYIVYVNKNVSSDFLFCLLRPAKHKKRWGHNLQGAHFDGCSDYFTESTSWSCKLWQNDDFLRKHLSFSEKHLSFSENVRKLPISIIWNTDYWKGFMPSLVLRIIEVWLYCINSRIKNGKLARQYYSLKMPAFYYCCTRFYHGSTLGALIRLLPWMQSDLIVCNIGYLRT